VAPQAQRQFASNDYYDPGKPVGSYADGGEVSLGSVYQPVSYADREKPLSEPFDYRKFVSADTEAAHNRMKDQERADAARDATAPDQMSLHAIESMADPETQAKEYFKAYQAAESRFSADIASGQRQDSLGGLFGFGNPLAVTAPSVIYGDATSIKQPQRHWYHAMARDANEYETELPDGTRMFTEADPTKLSNMAALWARLSPEQQAQAKVKFAPRRPASAPFDYSPYENTIRRSQEFPQ
jgi:hypothetical protein